MKKHILLILTLFGLISIAASESLIVSGHIYDYDTEKPIIGVVNTVIRRWGNSHRNSSAFTNTIWRYG